MPSSEKLFTLDPVATTLTTPTTDVRVQGPVSRKAENSQLVKGLASFSSALGSLGAVKKQREILTDTRLAENAAIRGEAEPAGLFGVASEAFDRIVEANTLNKTLGEIKAFRAGTEGANLVNAPGTLSEKNDAADKVFDTFLAYGYTPIQTPALQADFYQKVEAQRNETKIEIAKVNSDRNKLQVIERLKGVFNDVVTSSSKYSGGTSDQTDIEGASEYSVPFSLTENINPKLINTLAKDVVALDMDIDLPEAKLLTMQVLFQNEDVISQPSVSDKLMASEYAPGITYNALYIKGLSANNTDKDAAEIVKIRNSQIKATSDHFKNLDAQDKADALTRTKNGEAAVAEALTNGQSNEDAYAIGFQFGLTKGEINPLVTAQDKFEGNLKFGINTPEGQAFKKEILAGKNLTDDEITVAAYNRNLDNIPYYKSLAGLENNQIKQIQEAYDKPITLVKANAMMLLKNALRGTNANLPLMIKDSNGVDQFNVAALMASMGAKGINPRDAMDAIMRLQGIQNDFEHRSNEAAKNGATSNTFSGADVTQFTNSYHTEIRLFVTDLTKDIITIEEVAAARKQEAKEAKKIKEGAEKVEVEPEETSEAIIPPPSAEEQIENLTELKNNPNSLINRLTEDATIFYNKLTKSKPKETPGILYERDISPVEQKYLDKLNKTTTDVTGKITDKQPRTTGLGPAVDAIDSFFDKVGDNAGFLMDTVEDMQREKILYNTFKDFFITKDMPNEDSSTISNNGISVGKALTSSEQEIADEKNLTDLETDLGISPKDNKKSVEKAIDKVFPNNANVKAALMSTILNESNYNPTEESEDGGFGLIQFTKDQRIAFNKWLKDTDNTPNAISTMEYIKILATGTDKEIALYHDIGSTNRKTGRELFNSGTKAELSDFLTDKVVRPGDKGGKLRAEQRKKRRDASVSQSKGK